MQWFKHDSDASNDAKLRKLRFKYGAQGYGIFWYCLELIARNVDKNNLTFELEHDAELIAEDFRLSSELVQEMMTYMVKLGLFENSGGIITCLKMSTRTDEYTQKLISKHKKYPDTIPTLSVQNPEMSVLIEKNRIEENKTIVTFSKSRFDDFWKEYPSSQRKVAKATCEKKWQAKKLSLQADEIIAHIRAIKNSQQWKDGFAPAPLTYINQERWHDEIHQDESPLSDELKKLRAELL